MHRLLQRLDRRLQWALVAPQRDMAEPRRYPALLQRVLAVRAEMGLTPDQPESRHAFSAAGVWHLISTDLAGVVAGSVRLYVIDRLIEPLEPADIIRISHVEFPSDEVRVEHLAALQRLFDLKADERYFIAAGGLFTTPAWRGSGLAALLGVAAIAMARWHGSRFSASYTAVRGRSQDLFSTFGGKPPLSPDGQPLAAFPCGRHGFDLQLLIFDSHDPGGRVELGVDLMMQRLNALMPRAKEAA